MEKIREAKGYKVMWVVRHLKNVHQIKEYATLKGYKNQWVNIMAKRMKII